MSVRDEVLAAPNPKAALLVLADAIDKLNESNGWDSWGEEEDRSDFRPAPTLSDDDDDPRVAEARRRLAADQGKEPTPELGLEKKNAPILEKNPDGSVTVNLPTEISDEQKAYREKFVSEVLSNDYDEVICNSYLKGGPLVLYYTDRDYVMGLSDEWKRAIVRDVTQSSPKEGYDVGRDLLKDMSPGDLPSLSDAT